MKVIDKKVELNLLHIDGNAFFILGAFSKAARKAGWTTEEEEAVVNEATSDDYTHLLAVIKAHCE